MRNDLKLPPINEEAITGIKEEIDGLTGLHDVKRALIDIEAKARALRQRLESGEGRLSDNPLHMVFHGPPGTGKTTVARLCGRLLHGLGIVDDPEIRDDINASRIVGEDGNKSSQYVRQLMETSSGKVLFIDDAHHLTSSAREAMEALSHGLGDHVSGMIVILSGSGDAMHDLLSPDAMPDSQAPRHTHIDFPDYTADELTDILGKKMGMRGYTLGEGLTKHASNLIRRRMMAGGFANVHGVEALLDEIIGNHERGKDPGSRVITRDDLPPLARRDEALLEKARKALEELVGIDAVRKKLQEIHASILYDLEDITPGDENPAVLVNPGNIVFSGPSGTGKTITGQLLGDLFYGMGNTVKPGTVIVTRDDLVGADRDETVQKVRAAIDRARGGVLLIRDIRSIVSGSLDANGTEAVMELAIQIASQGKGEMIIILSGREDETIAFMKLHNELEGKFPLGLQFPHLTPVECAELAKRELEREGFQWEDGLLGEIQTLAGDALRKQGERFRNARWLRDDVLGPALLRMKERVVSAGIPRSDARHRLILLKDLQQEHTPDERCGCASDGLYVPDVAKPWKPRPEALRLKRPHRDGGQRGIEDIEKAICESAFQIITRELDEAGEQRECTATGFFVTPDGLMATCKHVVEVAETITVLCGSGLTGRRAEVVLTRDDLDFALVAVDVPYPSPYLQLGESIPVVPLTELYVYGNAHVNPGEEGRFVRACVTRNDPDDAYCIETDGDVDKGFSGGPVYDPSQRKVIALVKGERGRSAKLMIRAEQIKEIISGLGYSFD